MHFLRLTLLLLIVTLLGYCSSNKTTPSNTENLVANQKNINQSKAIQSQVDKPSSISSAKSSVISKNTDTLQISQKQTPQTQTTIKPTQTTEVKSPVKSTTATNANANANSSLSSIPKGAIKGKITLLDVEGKNVSAEGAIIELKQVQPNLSKMMEAKSHLIDTRAKTYMPGFLLVNVGDTLTFKNNDAIKHNVFSSSGKNTFDLGTYGFNREKQHQVAHEGIIKVYCNIHPEMALFISASNGNKSFITDSTGEYSFKDLEPGKYTISVWHLRGIQEKTIIIKGQVTGILNVSIDTSSYKPEPRVNKHGEAYKKQPAIFKDEFY